MLVSGNYAVVQYWKQRELKLTITPDAAIEEKGIALAVAVVAGLEEAVLREGVAGFLGLVDVAELLVTVC